ncbi:hypothetical protein [Saccharicrinis aurantiacus]|uniref:hypothetical protein n=1 Tax=Saccharicrinis aurantiacus TaxID=1849719 RepID=UPI00248FE5C7|nr:hypothetical protein [Saccharicrinis aurantiacus]
MSLFNGKGPGNKGSGKGRGLGKCNPRNEESAKDTATMEPRTGRGMRRRFRNSGKGLGRGRKCQE